MREQVEPPEGKVRQNGLMGKSWSSLFTLTKLLTFLDTMGKKNTWGKRKKKKLVLTASMIQTQANSIICSSCFPFNTALECYRVDLYYGQNTAHMYKISNFPGKNQYRQSPGYKGVVFCTFERQLFNDLLDVHLTFLAGFTSPLPVQLGIPSSRESSLFLTRGIQHGSSSQVSRRSDISSMNELKYCINNAGLILQDGSTSSSTDLKGI